jgi:filamentous hemagglutinin
VYQHGQQVNPNNMSDQQVLGAASWYWQAYFSSDDGEVNNYTGAVAGAIVNTASQIASGHGWAKHQGEFPGWDQGKYEDTVRETMQQPDEVRTLSNNRTAYWNAKENMVVIENPADPDGGTAFRPMNGKAYFDELK